MRKIKIEEYNNLPLNDPRKREIGEKYILRYYDEIEPREIQIGNIVQLFEVIKLTERGHEVKLVMFKIVK